MKQNGVLQIGQYLENNSDWGDVFNPQYNEEYNIWRCVAYGGNDAVNVLVKECGSSYYAYIDGDEFFDNDPLVLAEKIRWELTNHYIDVLEDTDDLDESKTYKNTNKNIKHINEGCKYVRGGNQQYARPEQIEQEKQKFPEYYQQLMTKGEVYVTKADDDFYEFLQSKGVKFDVRVCADFYERTKFSLLRENKNVKRINESQLKTIVTESVKRVLKEFFDHEREADFFVYKNNNLPEELINKLLQDLQNKGVIDFFEDNNEDENYPGIDVYCSKIGYDDYDRIVENAYKINKKYFAKLLHEKGIMFDDDPYKK